MKIEYTAIGLFDQLSIEFALSSWKSLSVNAACVSQFQQVIKKIIKAKTSVCSQPCVLKVD